MKKVPINRIKIESLLRKIETDLEKMKTLKKYSFEELISDKFLIDATENLVRKSLQAVFDISNHILSRISMSPSERPTTYKGMALAMGKNKIVENKFSQNQLFAMAGYRNRIIHFYYEVTQEEIYSIIQKDLGDYEKFLSYIEKILANPKKFGLEIE